MLFKSYMKTMKTYYIPETEVMDLHADKLMESAGVSNSPEEFNGGGLAPGRVGSLGPSY